MIVPIVMATLCVGLAPSTSFAQQSVSFHIGGFVPKGEDARSRDDVLVNNLDFLDFDIGDFKGPSVGGEWLVALTDNLEAGLGVGIYSRTSNAIYDDFVDSDGTEIETDLKMRIVPFTATVRFLPIGRYASVVPYVGAGVGVFSWRYAETGEFVDFSDFSIFRDTFEKTGTSTGPVFLGGARVPFGAGFVGFEVRYQDAKGELPIEDFFGSEVDLRGFSYLATFGIGF
jgi:outer membrane protein W